MGRQSTGGSRQSQHHGVHSFGLRSENQHAALHVHLGCCWLVGQQSTHLKFFFAIVPCIWLAGLWRATAPLTCPPLKLQGHSTVCLLAWLRTLSGAASQVFSVAADEMVRAAPGASPEDTAGCQAGGAFPKEPHSASPTAGPSWTGALHGCQGP